MLSYGQGSNRVALKMVRSVDKKGCEMLRNEFKMLRGISHPNIIESYKLKEVRCPGRTQSIP